MIPDYCSMFLTDDDIRFANEYEEQVNNTATVKGGRSYTGLEGPGRYACGELGTIATVRLLRACGVRVDYEPKADGKPDRGDLIVYRSGHGRSIDVKTRSEAQHDLMMVPEIQFQHRIYNGYIAARMLDRNWVAIHGWLTRDELTDRGDVRMFVGETRVVELKCPPLNPMHELIGILDKA